MGGGGDFPTVKNPFQEFFPTGRSSNAALKGTRHSPEFQIPLGRNARSARIPAIGGGGDNQEHVQPL